MINNAIYFFYLWINVATWLRLLCKINMDGVNAKTKARGNRYLKLFNIC